MVVYEISYVRNGQKWIAKATYQFIVALQNSADVSNVQVLARG